MITYLLDTYPLDDSLFYLFFSFLVLTLFIYLFIFYFPYIYMNLNNGMKQDSLRRLLKKFRMK
jgi:hypothetical protein